LGALHLDSRNCEVRNPDGVRSPLKSQPFLSASDFGNSGFRRCRDKNPRQQDSQNCEVRNPEKVENPIQEQNVVRDFGVSTFQFLESGRVKELDIRDCQTSKSKFLCGLNERVG
jgi:hypothetical protein